MKKVVQIKLNKMIGVIILFCFTLNFFPIQLFSQTPIMQIAVLNFENTSKDSKYDYLSSSIAESLTTFLIKYANNKIVVIERNQLEKAVKELALQSSGFTDEKTALQVGKLTNATHIIIGSYTVIDNVIRINARLISVETGKGILAESVTGKGGSESFNQINKLSAKIIESLTGEKVKIENFKDIQNPFDQIQAITKKKSNLVWIVLGVAAIAALALTLGKSEQNVNQSVTVK